MLLFSLFLRFPSAPLLMCGGTLFMTQNNCCLSHPYLMVTAEQITYLWFIRGEIPSGFISYAGRYGGPICTGICKAGGLAHTGQRCAGDPLLSVLVRPLHTHNTSHTIQPSSFVRHHSLVSAACQKKTSECASMAGQGVQAQVPVDMAKPAERLEVPLWLEQVRRLLLSQ